MEPTILMCPPDHYGIEYEINPWMSRRRPADHRRAMQQWQRLRELLEQAGATIRLLDPVEGVPDLVFTANAAMIYQNTAYLSRFRYPERQREVPYNEAWFIANGFETKTLPEGIYFEGAGDALFCGDTLFAGYRMRSDAKGHRQLAEMLNVREILLELVDAYYYHLDTCFCPLSGTQALYFPPAFDEYGRNALQAVVPELIEVNDREARQFACNAIVVGKTVVMNAGCQEVSQKLQALGFEVFETPLDEFVKAGGSAKCLTLRLDGEEAAAWKDQ